MSGKTIPQPNGNSSTPIVSVFTFRGALHAESFTGFAIHRAARLDLMLDLGACSEDACALTVRGPTALVDAFEMAVSLGPHDCIVLDVERHDQRPNQLRACGDNPHV